MTDKWDELRARVQRECDWVEGTTGEAGARYTLRKVMGWMSELDKSDRLSEAEVRLANVIKLAPPTSDSAVLAQAIGFIIAHLREDKP
jgi:hypothetical protein